MLDDFNTKLQNSKWQIQVHMILILIASEVKEFFYSDFETLSLLEQLYK